MTITTALLLLLAILVEIAREVSFKRGADASADAPKGGYLRRAVLNPMVLFGFFCWFVEIVAWIQVLSRVPLSVAFPIMSLCYVGTIIASKYVLKETISPKKWLGVFCITVGVAIIGSQGIG